MKSRVPTLCGLSVVFPVAMVPTMGIPPIWKIALKGSVGSNLGL
jgi:hypothetical protein